MYSISMYLGILFFLNLSMKTNLKNTTNLRAILRTVRKKYNPVERNRISKLLILLSWFGITLRKVLSELREIRGMFSWNFAWKSNRRGKRSKEGPRMILCCSTSISRPFWSVTLNRRFFLRNSIKLKLGRLRLLSRGNLHSNLWLFFAEKEFRVLPWGDSCCIWHNLIS